jgi:abortive infection bacteriophage resistance protein
VGDRERCLRALQTIGYYRLSAYWYPFRLRDEDHQEGIDTPSDRVMPGLYLDEIVAIYEFDRKLKTIIWDAIERVEIAVRVAVAYLMGQYDRFSFLHTAFLAPECVHQSQLDPTISNFEAFRRRLETQIRDSGEDFARHFRAKYNSAAPVWVAIELWDFGTLSRFYQLMLPTDRERVSQEFCLPGSRILGGWLEAINIVRNICAHHGRLNRRHLANSLRLPNAHGDPTFRHVRALPDRDKHRLYPILCALAFLLRTIDPSGEWRGEVIRHFDAVPKLNGLSLADYGIPETWGIESLWQTSPNQ